MWQVVVIIICLGLNGLLAATELAFVSISRPRLKKLAAEGDKSAKRVLDLRDNPEKTLSILQIGITFIGVIAAAVGGAAMDGWATPWLMSKFNLPGGGAEVLAIFLFVIPYTYFNVVLSELLPKNLALLNPKMVIFKMSPGVIFLGKVLAPMIYLLEKSTKAGVKVFSSWFKREEYEKEEPVAVGKLLRPYMLNLAKLEGKKVKDAMIPWNEVDKISVSASIKDVKGFILKTGHTRIPIVENGLPIGLLFSKEFIAFEEKQDPHWQKLKRRLIRVEEGESLIHAFRRMQGERSHLSIVMRGELSVGIVTIEDILEEVVGEIYDEDDILNS